MAGNWFNKWDGIDSGDLVAIRAEAGKDARNFLADAATAEDSASFHNSLVRLSEAWMRRIVAGLLMALNHGVGERSRSARVREIIDEIQRLQNASGRPAPTGDREADDAAGLRWLQSIQDARPAMQRLQSELQFTLIGLTEYEQVAERAVEVRR